MEQERRKVFVLRHAERLDFTFPNWVNTCFDNENYVPNNMNMPSTLAKRHNGSSGYRIDTPLTQVGLYQGSLLGTDMLMKGIKFTHAFCSPAFRCIQTIDAVLKGLTQSEITPICIEPGFFEFRSIQNGMPNWLSISELQQTGYNINGEYRPFRKSEDMQLKKESISEYYDRNFDVMKKIINLTKEQGGGNILVVAHSTTLDACSRQLTGYASRSYMEMCALVQAIPYCSLMVLEERPVNQCQPGPEWQLVDSQFFNFKHSSRNNFDSTVITNKKLQPNVIEKNKNNPLYNVTGRR